MSSGLIIVAEDDPMLRKLYRDLLETHGYTVIVAQDGAEALALLATNVPRLLILDVMMPGVDGIEVCRKVRPRLGDRVPILFLTALDDLDTLHACIAAGGDDYVVKSGSPDVLLQRVNHWLQSPTRAMAEVKRRRTIAQVEDAIRKEETRRPAEAAPAAKPSDASAANLNDAEVSRMAELVRRANAAAGGDFGATVEQRLFLLGYVSGIVDQAGECDAAIKARFRDYLRGVLCETGILEPDEVQQMFAAWDEMARDHRFAAAFRDGRRDGAADRAAERQLAPSGLRAV